MDFLQVTGNRMGESEIDRIMTVFHLRNCMVNQGYMDILKMRLTGYTGLSSS